MTQEDLGFIPSTVRHPRWAVQICEKKCREKGFKFFELAGIVTEEEGTTRMINLCRNCFDKMHLGQGEGKVDGGEWKGMIRQKASRGKLLAAFGEDDFQRKMW